MLYNWSISSELIINEAKRRNLSYKIIKEDKNLFYLSDGDKNYLFKNVDCGINSSLGSKISSDKSLTYNLLGSLGYNIPKTLYISNKDFYKIDEK